MKHSIINKKTIFALFTLATLSFSACKSAPLEISDDMTYQELIQKGQDSYQNNKYDDAFTYYQAVIDRYGTNASAYVEAKYEIGHLYMKQNNYKKAQPIFEEIQDIFRNSLPGTLPAAYNKLSEIELAKIPNTKQALAVQQAAAEAAASKQTETADEY